MIIFIVGPTATGKSEVACRLAGKINAEIISCDSMQIYKGMDILSCKPQPAVRKKIAHHLMDVVSPEREYDVSRYRREAVKAVRGVIRRGRTPLFVGGTGLYMSLLIDGIFELKPPPMDIRDNLYREAGVKGTSVLYGRLKEIDPEAAARIHPHDTKRIIRALEVFEASGETISALQKRRKGLAQEYPIRIFGLNMPRERLYARIDARSEQMFKQGLVNEVKRLLRLRLSRTAAFAIGIREVKGYLDGKYDLEEAKRLMQRNTRMYAKRQLTWFRKDGRIEWLEVGEKEKSAETANRIFKKLKTGPVLKLS